MLSASFFLQDASQVRHVCYGAWYLDRITLTVMVQSEICHHQCSVVTFGLLPRPELRVYALCQSFHRTPHNTLMTGGVSIEKALQGDRAVPDNVCVPLINLRLWQRVRFIPVFQVVDVCCPGVGRLESNFDVTDEGPCVTLTQIL